MAIFDFNTGEKLSRREIKRRVLNATGWTSEEYNKQYDILRNKVRTYEKVTGTKIGEVNEFLYKEQLAKRRYGAAYKPSALVAAVRATESVGTGAKAQAKAAKRVTAKAYETLFRQYRQLGAKYKPVGEFIAAVKATPSGYTVKGVKERLGELAAELEAYQRARAEEARATTGYPSRRLRGAYDAGSTYEETKNN